MTGRDSPHDHADTRRPTRRRRRGPHDPARVADTTVGNAVPPDVHARDMAASHSPPPAAVGRASGRNRALAPRLTAPDVVAITDKQYREAVDLLAAMIVSWVQRDRADTPPQQP